MAQSVKWATLDQPIVGSNPTRGARLRQKARYSAEPVSVWKHVKLPDVSLGARPRCTVEDEEDVTKPNICTIEDDSDTGLSSNILDRKDKMIQMSREQFQTKYYSVKVRLLSDIMTRYLCRWSARFLIKGSWVRSPTLVAGSI